MTSGVAGTLLALCVLRPLAVGVPPKEADALFESLAKAAKSLPGVAKAALPDADWTARGQWLRAEGRWLAQIRIVASNGVIQAVSTRSGQGRGPSQEEAGELLRLAWVRARARAHDQKGGAQEALGPGLAVLDGDVQRLPAAYGSWLSVWMCEAFLQRDPLGARVRLCERSEPLTGKPMLNLSQVVMPSVLSFSEGQKGPKDWEATGRVVDVESSGGLASASAKGRGLEGLADASSAIVESLLKKMSSEEER